MRDALRGVDVALDGSAHGTGSRSDGSSTMPSLLLWRCCVGDCVGGVARGSCDGLLLASVCNCAHICPSTTRSLKLALRSLKRSKSRLPPASPEDDHGLRPRSPSSEPATCGELDCDGCWLGTDDSAFGAGPDDGDAFASPPSKYDDKTKSLYHAPPSNPRGCMFGLSCTCEKRLSADAGAAEKKSSSSAAAASKSRKSDEKRSGMLQFSASGRSDVNPQSPGTKSPAIEAKLLVECAGTIGTCDAGLNDCPKLVCGEMLARDPGDVDAEALLCHGELTELAF